MNYRKVLYWSITVALGGFLFGFDTAVISGGVDAIKELWGLNNAMTGQMVAMALYGTVIGALFGGIPADRIGRKRTLFWIAILYLISAAGSALAPDVYSLMIFRFIGGLGVGASSVVAPMYIAEIAPTQYRGRLTAIFQFNLVLGILIAYVSNWMIGGGGDGGWRIMLGVEVIPALAFVFMILGVPRSPRWLVVKKGLVDEAREVLNMIYSGSGSNAETILDEAGTNPVDAALAAMESSDNIKGSGFKEFISGRFNLPIMLAFVIAFFNQLSGINAVIYYAPSIFKDTGMEESSALLSTAGVGLVNLIFTMAGLYLIDRMGRRFLMYIGSVGYIVSLAFVSWAFYTQSFDGFLVPFWIFAFIASHAIGQGAVIWVFISEIFPNEVRGFGNSMGCGTHWVFAALVAGTFPYIEGQFDNAWPIFAFFSFMMVLQLLWVWRVMPETKGVSLEDLEKQLVKSQ
ncbi:MAG: sugar porter family MFS transporter [Bacteroidota bacterium]